MDEATRDRILEKQRNRVELDQAEIDAIIASLREQSDPSIFEKLRIDLNLAAIDCPQCKARFLPKKIAELYICPKCGTLMEYEK